MNMEIDTYGNVDTLYYVMQGIASFMGSGTWTGLIRYTLLSGVLIWTVVALGKKGYEIFRWFAAAMLMTQLLLLPVENVFITDVNNVQPTREVDHVPMYLAAVAQSFTLISRVLTQSYETVFSVPDTLTLKKGDVGFGISVLQKVSNAEITDPGLHADLMQFFKECTVYDIQDGAIDPKTIMSGTDPFNTVFTSTSPARYVTTNTLTANPTTDTCAAIGTLLLMRVQDAEQAAEQMYGSEMYPEISDPSMAKAEFVNAIGDSYGFILQSSQNASSALRQAMFNNVWRQAGAELPSMLNDPARVAEVNALMSSAQAAVATNGSLSTMAILAKNTLPTVRNYAEAIIYAVFPLILVLCLISGADGAKRILGMYMKTVAWVSLWPLLFAVINGLSLIHLSHQMRSMSLQAGVPFGMASKFGSTLLDEQALLGYMVMLTPPLTWLLLNFASAGITGAFSQLTGVLSGPAQTIGGQQAQGDENIGNVHMDSSSIDNASRNVTSANKMDTAMQSRWGSQSVDTGNGSQFTNFGNGLIARTDTQNNLGVSAMSQGGFDRSVGTDTSTAIAANRTSSKFSGSEKVASGTTSLANNQDRGNTQRYSDDATSGTRGSTTQSGERRTSVDQQYGVDQSHSVEGQKSAGGKISGALGGGFDRSFEDAATPAANGAGGGNGPSGGNGRGPGGNGRPGNNNSAANSPLFNQADEDKLVRKAESLGKSPQEVQAVRDAYRSRVQAADFATGGGTGKGRSNLRIGLDISGEAGYTRLWRNSEAQKFVDQYGSLGAVTDSDQVSREGSQMHSDSTGMDSAQHVRRDQSASLTSQASAGSRQTADLSRTTEVRQRGSAQMFSRVETSTNLMTPENLQAVAARNGMRYSQLMTLPAPEIARLLNDDASMKDVVSRNSTLPTTARDGSSLPAGQNDVLKQNQRNQAGVGDGTAAAYQRYAAAVGPVDTTPLDIATPMPQIVTDAQGRVDQMRQRVAEDGAVPIKQVRDNTDPSTANKPLMTPERAPGRPVQSAPAQARAPAAQPATPLDAWRNDLSMRPAAFEAGRASPAAVDKFLRPETGGSGPTLEAARTSTTGLPATTAPRLSESDIRIERVDTNPPPSVARNPSAPVTAASGSATAQQPSATLMSAPATPSTPSGQSPVRAGTAPTTQGRPSAPAPNTASTRLSEADFRIVSLDNNAPPAATGNVSAPVTSRAGSAPAASTSPTSVQPPSMKRTGGVSAMVPTSAAVVSNQNGNASPAALQPQPATARPVESSRVPVSTGVPTSTSVQLDSAARGNAVQLGLSHAATGEAVVRARTVPTAQVRPAATAPVAPVSSMSPVVRGGESTGGIAASPNKSVPTPGSVRTGATTTRSPASTAASSPVGAQSKAGATQAAASREGAPAAAGNAASVLPADSSALVAASIDSIASVNDTGAVGPATSPSALASLNRPGNQVNQPSTVVAPVSNAETKTRTNNDQ